jgi:hypothetical protein
MAETALQWLATPAPARVPAARAMVQTRFDWTRNLDAYERVLRGPQRTTFTGSIPASARARACP